jgi:CHAT domain-containing protein
MADEGHFKKQSPTFRILHIASHTVTDDKRPDLSCFIMNSSSDGLNDGRLHAFEIKQLKLNAQLAVLSGCNTGYGKLGHSEGFLSLARSFFFTGIRTVAYTLWQASDRSSESIIKEFYSGITNGESFDEALRYAKIRFIEEADPVRAHPYFWAGFIISGKAQRIARENFNAEIIFILVFLLITSVVKYYL